MRQDQQNIHIYNNILYLLNLFSWKKKKKTKGGSTQTFAGKHAHASRPSGVRTKSNRKKERNWVGVAHQMGGLAWLAATWCCGHSPESHTFAWGLGRCETAITITITCKKKEKHSIGS
jgi:hypothetical protein